MEKINDSMITREDALAWCQKNRYLINNSIRFTSTQVAEFFQAYNLITGEGKQVTGCGRCILAMKQRLQTEMAKKEKEMTTYPVYLTAKGNYTFKETPKLVAYIRATNSTSAKEQLEIMKKQAKADVQ